MIKSRQHVACYFYFNKIHSSHLLQDRYCLPDRLTTNKDCVVYLVFDLSPFVIIANKMNIIQKVFARKLTEDFYRMNFIAISHGISA